MRSGKTRWPVLIEHDQDQVASRDEIDPVSFFKDLIKLHSTAKQQWLLLPTRADARFTNALNSNVFIPRAIGISDKDFVEALFLDVDSHDAKIKYLEETFGVKVATLQIGLSLSSDKIKVTSNLPIAKYSVSILIPTLQSRRAFVWLCRNAWFPLSAKMHSR